MLNNKYFLNKVCTIFTVLTNRNFKEENPRTHPQPIYHYFMGKVIQVDENYVWIEQWAAEKKKLKTRFAASHIIAIAEEEQLDPSDPEDARVINEMKTVNEEVIQKSAAHVEQVMEQKNQFIDVNNLANMSDLMKKTFGK